MAAVEAATVLLYVEDEELIQQVVIESLEEAGFEVRVAASGVEALEELEAAADGTVRGLITDINLGNGPDGWDVARRARELNHGLPVVYVSGKSEHEWTSKGVPHSVMIAKPFAPAQIIVAVSSLLNSTNMES